MAEANPEIQASLIGPGKTKYDFLNSVSKIYLLGQADSSHFFMTLGVHYFFLFLLK